MDEVVDRDVEKGTTSPFFRGDKRAGTKTRNCPAMSSTSPEAPFVFLDRTKGPLNWGFHSLIQRSDDV